MEFSETRLSKELYEKRNAKIAKFHREISQPADGIDGKRSTDN
jgi:hypothetical protein